MTTHRTLVPIDLSATSLVALDYAMLLAAKEPGATVRVVHALPLPTVPLGPGEVLFRSEIDDRMRLESDRALREIVEKKRSTVVALETQLLVGPAPSAIVEDATAQHVDRIVLGSSQPGPLTRLLLGSVADRVVRTSPVEVVVVPVPVDGERPRSRIRNVVCATDFSGPAETALLRAIEIVRAHDARLHLVHAWHVAPYVERIPELRASIERELARELDAAAHRHEMPGVPVLRHLRRGDPAHEIVHAAIELDADLVVVGTTGKRGVDRLLLGSVAERVARTAHSPVLVARAVGDASRSAS